MDPRPSVAERTVGGDETAVDGPQSEGQRSNGYRPVATEPAPGLLCRTGALSLGTSPCVGSVNPLRGKTTDRRAVCGKSACTVRRGEGPKSIGPSYCLLYTSDAA